MHDGCISLFENGRQMIDKIRMMGFSQMATPAPLAMTCKQCQTAFFMTTMEFTCPSCGMVYGVTPCHADRPENVMAAGVGY